MAKIGMSIRAYAQHRGVSHTAVIKAIDDGRIMPLADGSIDAQTADKQWQDNTNPVRSPAPSGIKAIQEIKLKNEAALLHYKVQKESGAYIPKDEARKIVSVVFADLREKFINRCQRLAPRLVNQTDILKVSRLLEEDARQMLTEYINDFNERILAAAGQAADVEENAA
jgi:hypothetical protein